MTPIRLVFLGAPRTKKNHNRLVTAGERQVVLPSKPWVDWVKTTQLQYDAKLFPLKTLSGEWNCAALFYRDATRGDLVGYMQGLADLLEKRRVVHDDKQIVGWDGSRLLVDKARPRVEVTLTPVVVEAAA